MPRSEWVPSSTVSDARELLAYLVSPAFQRPRYQHDHRGAFRQHWLLILKAILMRLASRSHSETPITIATVKALGRYLDCCDDQDRAQHNKSTPPVCFVCANRTAACREMIVFVDLHYIIFHPAVMVRNISLRSAQCSGGCMS